MKMKNKNNEFFNKDTINKLVGDIGVAFWVWDIKEDQLHYNNAFYEILGYKQTKEYLTVDEWIELIHPDDRDYVDKQIQNHLEGNTDSYVAECRFMGNNCEPIWIIDSGRVTGVDENGEVTQLSGIIQCITERKEFEKKVKTDENNLKLAMKFAGFSVWQWDIQKNVILYDKKYPETLGYIGVDWGNSVEKWDAIIHPVDLKNLKQALKLCVGGKSTTYNQKLRVRKGNGEYIWVRDVGEVAQYDINGNPSILMGGRINIDELESAKIKLEEYQEDLQLQIKKGTEDLLRRDTALLELNQLSQQLVSIPKGVNFENEVYKFLGEFTSVGDTSRVAVYRTKEVEGKEFCYLANQSKNDYITEFTLDDIKETFKNVSINFISEGNFNDDQREEFYNIILNNMQNIDFNYMDFKKDFSTVYDYVIKNKTLNIKPIDFTPREFIFSQLQNIKSVLMSPIFINNTPWGFIFLDDFIEKTYTKDDEKILKILGSIISGAVHKNEMELVADEAIKYNNLLLNATPLGCNLWQDGININCNDEVIRLFEIDTQEEYLEKFHLLSPEYQPCGQKTADLIPIYLAQAEEKGFLRFEWLHHKLSGELLPCEITLVRIEYNDKPLIAGYIRDLREFKALLKDIEDSKNELEASNINLREAHEEALLSSKAKSNFLANMSHEIRTPMNAISGMTDIILRDTNDDDITDNATNIKRACDSLLSIINDVLDISKIESGKLDIVEGEYSLANALEDVLTIATNRLEVKPLMFISNFQNDLPDKLIGDVTRVKQVMVNILNNAIKFTPTGHISFDVSGEFAGGLLELKFSVTDTGVGISQKDIEKLFIEFERVNTTKNRNIEGTGLGLAISKRLAEMMDGTIEVESEIDKGTKFTVTILQKYNEYTPIAQIENDKPILIFEARELYINSMKTACTGLGLNSVSYCTLQSEFNEELQEKQFDYVFTSAMYLLKAQEMLSKFDLTSQIILLADNNDIKSKYDYPTIITPATCISIANILNGKNVKKETNENITKFIAPTANILIVDDNLVNLKVAQGLMKPFQFNIDTAENGLEGLEKIKNKIYDLVFMDHMMPVMDGIDATIAVRSYDKDYFQKLPIIALTANAIIGTREMFINEGMNDFLAKPIKLTALNEILSKWIPKDKQELVLDSNSNNDTDTDSSNTETIKEIKISAIDTDLGIQRVGGDFDTYIDILSMYYKDGVKRIPNIHDLFNTKKLLEYKIEVHALKSASASVGALYISEKARLLEEASIKEDWAYINQNTTEFIDDFNILLENIREALTGIIPETDNSNKELGDDTVYFKKLEALSIALDSVDISKCEALLEKLFSFSWGEEKLEVLNKISDFVNGYEYDEAIDIINEVISDNN